MRKHADHLSVSLFDVELNPVDGLERLDRANDYVAVALLEVNFDLFQFTTFFEDRSG